MFLSSIFSIYIIISLAGNAYGYNIGNAESDKGSDAIAEVNHNAQQPTNTATDIDGNVYKLVTIGTQVWMAENLKTTRFNDGTPIPLVTGNAEWSRLTTPGYSWFQNDSLGYGITYGAKYNWHAVNTGRLCPAGWRVATDADWTTLITYLGGQRVAGGRLKPSGATPTGSPQGSALDNTGFNAQLSGMRGGHGSFIYFGNYGKWWTSTRYDREFAWFRDMSATDNIVGVNYERKHFGFSVRCVQR